MLGIFTRALVYTVVFNAGIVIGGVYTPEVIELARSLDDSSSVQEAPRQQTPPAVRKRRIFKALV